MPSPFEILKQGDDNTARLFNSINAGLERAAQRQERSLAQTASLAIAKENILLNRAKLNFEEQKLAIGTFMDSARLKMSSALGAANLELSVRNLIRQDKQDKVAFFEKKLESLRKIAQARALSGGMEGVDAMERLEIQALSEIQAIEDSEIGDYGFMEDAIKRVGEVGTSMPNFFRGTGVSVFGGKNDPLDSGVNAWKEKTGPGGVEGPAIPESVFNQLGITSEEDKKNTKVRISDGKKSKTYRVADKGPREDIFRDRTIDVTEGVVKDFGGQVLKDERGKLSGVSGIGNLSIEVIPLNGIEPTEPTLTEAQADAIFNNVRLSGLNQDTGKYPELTDLKKASDAISRVMVAFSDNPLFGQIKIADIKRNAPAYKELQKSYLQDLAFTKNNATLDNLDNLQKLTNGFTEIGGSVEEYSGLKSLVFQRNNLASNVFQLSKQFDELQSKRQDLLDLDVRSGGATGDVREQKRVFVTEGGGLGTIHDAELTRLMNEYITSTNHLNLVQSKINEIAGIVPVEAPVVEPNTTTVGNVTDDLIAGRLGGSTARGPSSIEQVQGLITGNQNRFTNAADRIAEEKRNNQANRPFGEVAGSLFDTQAVTMGAEINSAIAETTNVSTEIFGLDVIGDENLANLKQDISDFIKSDQVLSTSPFIKFATDKLIKILRQDSESLTEEEIGSTEGNAKSNAALRLKEEIDKTTDEDLRTVGKLLVANGLIDAPDEASPFDTSFGASLGSSDLFFINNFANLAKLYLTDFSDKTNEEILDLIPLIKAARILNRFAG